ncbi:MAG: class I SAM-dependent methyltransferase [Chitinophagaceae bacterium]|nr:MAG: class I SAM-dependent methyltransferase [Chitinophagaceae bacterium]
MSNKFKTVIWFLKNPKYISQIFQVLKRKKNAAFENTSSEATSWCTDKCIPMEEALVKVLGEGIYESITTLFPDEIKTAREVAESTPVKMGGEGAISFIYHLVRKSPVYNLLETGVAYGWSSLAILLAIKDRQNAFLISNDMPYINMGNDDFVGCVVPDHLKSKWELQRLPDVKGIPLGLKKFNQSIDFCHYDSDKSYTGRQWASPILWKALSTGGLFISDDINDNIAFKQFCESVNRNPIIIKHMDKYVGVIIK